METVKHQILCLIKANYKFLKTLNETYEILDEDELIMKVLSNSIYQYAISHKIEQDEAFEIFKRELDI